MNPDEREDAKSSSSADIPISPYNALCKSFNVNLILSHNLFQCSSSYNSTTYVGVGTPN